MSTLPLPSECDYLVIGAGATALAFCDSLLQGCRDHDNDNSKNELPSIVLLDPHDRPGGQWIDSYDFVQLHQPSAMYGVESLALEEAPNDATHRATRQEILDYYQKVLQKWQPYVIFIDNARFDLEVSLNYSANDENASVRTYRYQRQGSLHDMRVRRKVVDARYLQPDLPVDTPPKFRFDAAQIKCIPVNDILVANNVLAQDKNQKYVVIGGGKTGMDTVYFLLTQRKVDAANDIVWIMPHDAWITARESIGNCLEFLHTSLVLAQQQPSCRDNNDLATYVKTSPNCLQQAFLKWEEQGKIYRLDPNILPTKFKDATLSKEELDTLRTVTNVIRGRGRITHISNDGDLHFENGGIYTLPWKESHGTNNTTFVHCSAGAFNYTKQLGDTKPIFTDHVLTIQDVYGTPGFCFVGSIMGKLESLSHLSNDQKNALCLAPSANTTAAVPPLGPSGGDIGTLGPSHGLIQRLTNVRQWLQAPELRNWLVGHRLFNLGHYPNADAIQSMVDEAWSIAAKSGLVE